MGRYEKKNIRVIEKAFDRLDRHKEKAIEEGMVRMLHAGLTKLLDSHKPWMHHKNENDTAGWALVHDGTIIRMTTQSEGNYTPKGYAYQRLMEVAGGLPKEGWCGIVMSDMANDWYRLDWEMNYLASSAEHVKNNFHSYFKKI